MLKKLQVKFVCFTMAIVAVMLCVIFGTVYSFTSQSLEAESLQMMETIGANPFQIGRLGQETEQVHLPYVALQINPFGDIAAVSGGYFDLSDEGYLREIIESAIQSGEDTGVLREYNLRFHWANSHLPRWLIFADISSEQATLNHLLKTCAVIGVGSLLAFLLLSVLLARWAVRPVERAWAQQKQFVADASHELKTPLTVILTNAELMQDEDCGEEARSRLADSILTMAHQMRGLVESLLELARVDNGAIKTAVQELDMSALVSDAVLPFEPLFFEQGLALETEIEAGVQVKGSGTHLRQVAEILLDNALKYAQPRSTVELRLKKQGGRCQLTVSSRGEEISKADLKNIFKRFYRVDKARGMDHSYGLGLAIAESIVTEHGGKIWAESTEGFNRFYVELTAV